MKHLKKIHEYPIIIHDKNTFIYRCFFRRYAGPFLQIPRCVLFFVFSAKSNHPPILHSDEKQKKSGIVKMVSPDHHLGMGQN